MSADGENFRQLRRLLTLKRYEQPPPRYFNDFSSQVIRRIEAGEGRTTSLWELFLGEGSWTQRIWEALEAKPALVGAFAVIVCGLLVTGVVFTGENGSTPTAMLPTAQGLDSGFAAMPVNTSGVAFRPPADQLATSTNLMIAPHPAGSLFDQFRLQAQPATFSINPSN